MTEPTQASPWIKSLVLFAVTLTTVIASLIFVVLHHEDGGGVAAAVRLAHLEVHLASEDIFDYLSKFRPAFGPPRRRFDTCL